MASPYISNPCIDVLYYLDEPIPESMRTQQIVMLGRLLNSRAPTIQISAVMPAANCPDDIRPAIPGLAPWVCIYTERILN